MKPLFLLRLSAGALVLLATVSRPCAAQATWDLTTATLRLDDRSGIATVVWPDGTVWPVADRASFVLHTDRAALFPSAVHGDGQKLVARYDDGSRAEFSVSVQPGFVLFRLEKLDSPASVERLELMRLAVPGSAEVARTINAATDGELAVAVMAAEPNVHAFAENPPRTLNVETLARYGIRPAAFAVLATPRDQLLETIQRFEQAAGLPSPRPGGEWGKRSAWVDRSYLFLNRFRESQFDDALQIARAGGFHMILIGQKSWARGTGHYEIDRDNFPDGLAGLQRTVQRFREAGFRVGLHFMAPSIYPPDAYLTPVPDPRLVKGAAIELAADVDAQTDFLPTSTFPDQFPAADGGYRGAGTVLQVGQELIRYGRPTAEEPYGFAGCRRGYLGTEPSSHSAGEPLRHLVRAYGYHMFDMDTSLLDEVADNFARVANACGIDMIYFDGSERLQGDHWYYNARLHQAFYDRLENKDVLLQASGHSHWSWHLMSRAASADGHGDLKGYLEQRAPVFAALARNGMPLDIGWYYGHDVNATPDMYEYVLGATIGYDSSLSFQLSTESAAQHPFTFEILDRISRYERLRLSQRVPESIRALLRIDPAQAGRKTPEQRARSAASRREYRLLEDHGQTVFQRVVYLPWQEVHSSDDETSIYPISVPARKTRVGFQVHLPAGAWLDSGPSYRSPEARVLESFDDLAAYTPGSVSAGVTQQLELQQRGGREGAAFAVYSASSSRHGEDGWSSIGRRFDPPLDLSWHRGIGFWLRGDGVGGLFKLQLRDERNATDYYIANDYTGWRYHQLTRPEKDLINYGQVRSLTFYYNDLPGRASVSCGIDDVKALRQLDKAVVVDPQFDVDGKRLVWRGTLNDGQYLTFWPGEPVQRHGPTAAERISGEVAETVRLRAGPHTARFSAAYMIGPPPRVRITLQPPSRHPIAGP